MTDLKKLDALFATMSRIATFSYMTPVNIAEAEHSFFIRPHNPILKYKKVPLEFYAIPSLLGYFKLEKKPIHAILNNIKREIKLKCLLIKARGTSDFTQYASKLYGKPTKTLVKKAYKILEAKFTKNTFEKAIDPIKPIQKACKDLGLDWSVRQKKLLTQAVVHSSKKIIEVQKNAKFPKSFINRLIVHELATHALRYENGQRQPYKFFMYGTAGYLATEEGLAVYNEYITGNLTPSILRSYAGRVIAVNYALQHSFVDTFRHLRKYFGAKQAFNLTMRAKRGLGDTSKPGACTKDIVYLQGFYLVQKYIKDGNNIKSLYIGKVAIKDIPLIRQISDLQKNINLPTFYTVGK